MPSQMSQWLPQVSLLPWLGCLACRAHGSAVEGSTCSCHLHLSADSPESVERDPSPRRCVRCPRQSRVGLPPSLCSNTPRAKCHSRMLPNLLSEAKQLSGKILFGGLAM